MAWGHPEQIQDAEHACHLLPPLVQVLDLLQNYSGLTAERLNDLMFFSGKQPK